MPGSNLSHQRALGSEPSSTSPAQEHIFPGSQEGQESSVAMDVHRGYNDDKRQTAVSFPRSSESHPTNGLEESSYSPQSDSSGNESSEQSPTAGRPDSEQPQLRGIHAFSEHSWWESNVAQIWDPSVRQSSSVDDQRRAGAEARQPWNHVGAFEPVLDLSPRNDAPDATFNALSHGGNVHRPLQMTTLPLPEMPGSHRNQEERLPPIDNTSLPSIAELLDPQPVDRWRSRPKYHWSGFLPDIYETRRLEWQTADGRPPALVQGPTPHHGPPLKPLDNAKAEDVAIEKWRLVVRDREIREAGGL